MKKKIDDKRQIGKKVKRKIEIEIKNKKDRLKKSQTNRDKK